jgi:glycerol uptake facilitator-like aquaporin
MDIFIYIFILGCLGAGFVVATLCHSIGHANLNPAVSIALLVTGDSNILRVLFYIPCQLLGSTLAVFTLRNLLPNHLTNQQFVIKQNITSENYIELSSTNNKITDFSKTIGLTLLNKDISPIQGFTIEFILTYVLVLCIYACIDTRRKDLNGSFPLSIGFSVVVGALIGVMI